MIGPFHPREADGSPRADDNVLSSFMKERADEVGGHIVDKAGTTVYPKEG